MDETDRILEREHKADLEREAQGRRLSRIALVVIAIAMAAAGASPARSEPSRSLKTLATPVADAMLTRAHLIRAEVDARYRPRQRAGLAVTEASPTGVIDSFTLFIGAAQDPRVVPSTDGIYYAICPVRATCPYPGRSSRSAVAFLPLRAALELTVRTFLESPADLVVVSLPTRRFVLLVVERDEFLESVDVQALRDALAARPRSAADRRLRRLVVELARPRLFVGSGIVMTPEGGETLVASSLIE